MKCILRAVTNEVTSWQPNLLLTARYGFHSQDKKLDNRTKVITKFNECQSYDFRLYDLKEWNGSVV